MRARVLPSIVLLACVVTVWASPAGSAPFAYIPAFDADAVVVLDTATNTIVATVTVGDGPFGIAVNATGTRVYVANQNGGNVSIRRRPADLSAEPRREDRHDWTDVPRDASGDHPRPAEAG